ncbi:MAG: cyanoexosortase B system-associated protein [Oscillatoriaceae bacterium SKW80]|nr:cyanoexosortase B system-associated protein [Oscillatoriaceae bacterium SKYG93]MCX8121276.1 cyanoexosortase B system-associated protein [Oscillatoriaceae bacterium SKW80]MDW8453390.1 cyanoexosortase B system-associated protein [Oscillatoriaceae cyanobacterium SKYGB_i_bin93]HIK26745.1 cyanoexosortase B system-associated protein [Oscillatoriaceae cyanobacterium M7585_C2015_266]
MLFGIKFQYRKRALKIILLLFLLNLCIFGALPSYLSGKWRWASPPEVTALPLLRKMQETGLTFHGWETVEKYILLIGGHNWLALELQRSPTIKNNHNQKTTSINKAMVMLMPQNDHTDQPQVEWTDINGLQQWKIDSFRRIEFTAAVSPKQPTVTVKANFFRSWNQQQTYAVLQWYATPEGGNPSPSWWFWADRRAQLSNRRVPWVAVNIVIPIEPLGDIEKLRSLAESLGQTVQLALMDGPFKKINKLEKSTIYN